MNALNFSLNAKLLACAHGALRFGVLVLAAALFFTLAWPGNASAALVTYTISGTFAGGDIGNNAFETAIQPKVANQAFSTTLTLDTTVTGSPLQSGPSGTQLFRAITSSTSSFAGFSITGTPCAGQTSDFICTAHVFNGTGQQSGGTGSDSFNLFSGIGRSAAFQTEIGESRQLDIQFGFFLTDITGNTIPVDPLTLDFSTVALSKMSGDFLVFAPTLTGGFDRADFRLSINSIVSGAPSNNVPEPGSLMLLAVAGLMLLVEASRRRQSTLRI